MRYDYLVEYRTADGRYGWHSGHVEAADAETAKAKVPLTAFLMSQEAETRVTAVPCKQDRNGWSRAGCSVPI